MLNKLLNKPRFFCHRDGNGEYRENTPEFGFYLSSFIIPVIELQIRPKLRITVRDSVFGTGHYFGTVTPLYNS